MKYLIGLLVVLFCMVGSSKAQDPLGTVSKVIQFTCPTVGLQGAHCYSLTVACPEIPNITIKVKLFSPAASKGLVVIGTGGLGNTYWDETTYGSTTVTTLEKAGLNVAELLFVGGWQANTNGLGMRKGACRYTTTVNWMKQNWSPSSPVCSAGVSAGGAVIGYGLSHYELDRTISFALLVSGPPFSRVDYACDNTQPATLEYCANVMRGMEVGVTNAEKFVDPAYYPTEVAACSTTQQQHSTQLDSIYLPDSINSTDANLNYLIPVAFMYGSLDQSPATNEGEYYRKSILSPTSRACIVDAPHAIANSLVGAQAVANSLITNCK